MTQIKLAVFANEICTEAATRLLILFDKDRFPTLFFVDDRFANSFVCIFAAPIEESKPNKLAYFTNFGFLSKVSESRLAASKTATHVNGQSAKNL